MFTKSNYQQEEMNNIYQKWETAYEMYLAFISACEKYQKKIPCTHKHIAKSMIEAIKDMKKMYVKDLRVVQNANDPHQIVDFFYTATSCFIIAVKQILVEKNSVKFQKLIDAIYEKYPEDLSKERCDELAKVYARGISSLQFYAKTQHASTEYMIDGPAVFWNQYQNFKNNPKKYIK